MTKLEEVRAAIISAVPEINVLSEHCGGDEDVHIWRECKECVIVSRPITLADVLRAMNGTPSDFFVDSEGGFHEWFAPKGRLDLRTVATWNLALPLDEQESGVIEFIGKVLGV